MQLRTYIDTVRSGIGRIATLTGTGLLGTGLFLHDAILPGLITTTAAALGGTFLSPRLMTAHPKKKAIACTLYLSPHLGLGSLLVAELVATGDIARWIEGGAALLWMEGVWWTRPAALGKRVAKWPEPAAEESAEADEEEAGAELEVAPAELPDEPVARWWALNATKKDGVAPYTRIVAVRPIEDGRRLAAAIASTLDGEPVPDINLKRLSALMDFPAKLLALEDIPGRGAGIQMLLIGPPPETGGDADVWTEIARSALPGVQLVEVNEYDMSKELTR
ncbi:hypothetical protein ACWCV5_28250 [Streptomyces tubercidicus]